MPVGARFCREQPNSMETVARTLAKAASGSVRVFCCQGADAHDVPMAQALPAVDRLKALRQALTDYRPDVIEFHQQTQQAVALARHFPDAAVTLYRHNAVKPPRHAVDRWRYERRYDRMDGLIFVSEAARSDFLKDFPRLKAKAFAVPNPIEFDLWRAPIENRQPVIAFAGRAMPEKGVDLICAALPAVLDRHPDWREVMQTAAVALTPSVWAEPLGLTALEAHAAGAALISSGRGGLREASGPHALYVDDLTAQGLTHALETLIDDPGRRETMARSAQAYVMEAHTPQRRAAQLSALRSTLVQSKRARRGSRG